MFEELGPETQPIAAASLGQVYRLKLKGTTSPRLVLLILFFALILRSFVAFEMEENGKGGNKSKRFFSGTDEFVAVKVQRPDMVRFILRDLYIMRCISIVIEKIKCKITNNRYYLLRCSKSYIVWSFFFPIIQQFFWRFVTEYKKVSQSFGS